MLNKTCFIVEDNKEDLNTLLSFIEKVSFLKVAGTATNYADAVKYLLENQVDLLFLDIQLSGSSSLTGFDILKTIPNAPSTIIMSNNSDFAVDAYNIGKSTDFLLKPFNFDRFLLASNRALSKPASPLLLKEEKSVFFKMGRKFQRFNLDEILYFEAYGIYLKVFLDINKKPMVINETISTISDHLNKNNFIRVHKSFIVNIDKITSFDGNHFYIDTLPIPIGISYKPKLDNMMKVFANIED